MLMASDAQDGGCWRLSGYDYLQNKTVKFAALMVSSFPE